MTIQSLSAKDLLTLQTQVAETLTGQPDEVDGKQQALDLNVLAQGGSAATDEIIAKMYSGVTDAAEQQKLAGETLAVFSAAGSIVNVQAPSDDAGAVDTDNFKTSINDATQNRPFDIGELIAELVALATQMKQADRVASMSDAETSADQLNQGADQTMQQASDTFRGALASGVISIGGGLIAGASSAAAMSSAMSAASTVNANVAEETSAVQTSSQKIAAEAQAAGQEVPKDLPTRASDNFVKAQNDLYGQMTAKTSHAQQIGQSLQATSGGAGAVTQGSFEQSATGHSAEKQRKDANSAMANARQDSDKTSRDNDGDLFKSALSFIEQQNQTEYEKNKAVIG